MNSIKQTTNLQQLQKLSPQQIQFIKLLQIPTAELQTRIEEELEINPALEEGRENEERDTPESDTEFDAPQDLNSTSEKEDTDNDNDSQDDFEESIENYEEISLNDYMGDDDYGGYKMQGDGNYQEEEREMPIATTDTLTDNLMMQLGFLNLSEHLYTVGSHLIGSLDGDGYLRRPITSIVNDLAFLANVETDESEVTQILKKIQQFDPPGIGAKDLQECLLIQLMRIVGDHKLLPKAKKIARDYAEEFANEEYPRLQHRLQVTDAEFRDIVELVLHLKAIEMLEKCFEEFTKKHFDKIQRKIEVNEEDMKEVVKIVLHLNPKPGGESNTETHRVQYVIPDFILRNNNGKLDVTLNSKNAPDLKINAAYADMLEAYSKVQTKDRHARETLTFVKQKLDAAKWFIDAIKQRQNTLLRTMNAIIDYQHEFFLEGDESKFKPMILKDIAEKIEMDISTISRVANSKSIQTDFGVFPLKYFFSEGISTESGEDVSSREVKSILKDLVAQERKNKPLSDDKLEKELKKRGYQIARRTVAKYREQLNIPVARLRKEL